MDYTILFEGGRALRVNWDGTSAPATEDEIREWRETRYTPKGISEGQEITAILAYDRTKRTA